MTTLSLQVTYRKGKASAAYIYLDEPGSKSARTSQLTPGVVVDFAADGHPIGIEIVDPSAVTIAEVLSVFDTLGLARPDEHELDPLQAA